MKERHQQLLPPPPQVRLRAATVVTDRPQPEEPVLNEFQLKLQKMRTNTAAGPLNERPTEKKLQKSVSGSSLLDSNSSVPPTNLPSNHGPVAGSAPQPRQQREDISPIPVTTLKIDQKNEKIEGYLSKKGEGFLAGWKSYWFSLKNDSHLVFYREQPKAGSLIPKGMLSLQFVVSIETISERECTFSLTTADRIWYLMASSRQGMNLWVSYLKKKREEILSGGSKILPGGVSDDQSSPIRPSSAEQTTTSPAVSLQVPSPANLTAFPNSQKVSRQLLKQEGILERLGLLGWRARWFVLEDGFLYYYNAKEKKQKKERGKIALYRCTIHKSKHPNSFEIRSKGTENIICKAKSQEELETWYNSILKQKAAIEEIIDSLGVNE